MKASGKTTEFRTVSRRKKQLNFKLGFILLLIITLGL